MTDAGYVWVLINRSCNPVLKLPIILRANWKTCTLKDNIAINGVNCKQYAPINLYETGMLKSCDTSVISIMTGSLAIRMAKSASTQRAN